MDGGIRLKRQGVFARMSSHPGGAILGGIVTAAICGIFGTFHGEAVAVVLAAMGAIMGAPLGAQMASSFGDHP